MQQVDYLDDDGCLRRALLPAGADAAEAPAGVPVGVEIALDVAGLRCRLQNELRRRGLWTQADVSRRRGRAAAEVFAALQAALRVDVAAILNQYALAEEGQALARKETPDD